VRGSAKIWAGTGWQGSKNASCLVSRLPSACASTQQPGPAASCLLTPGCTPCRQPAWPPTLRGLVPGPGAGLRPAASEPPGGHPSTAGVSKWQLLQLAQVGNRCSRGGHTVAVVQVRRCEPPAPPHSHLGAACVVQVQQAAAAGEEHPPEWHLQLRSSVHLACRCGELSCLRPSIALTALRPCWPPNLQAACTSFGLATTHTCSVLPLWATAV
jgi:hypothetical protein